MTEVSFPTTMIAYQANIKCVADPSPSSSRTKEEDPYVQHAWAVESSHSHYCLDDVFPSDEAIIETMSGVEYLGRNCIIDHIFLLSLIIWSVMNLGRFLATRLIAPWLC